MNPEQTVIVLPNGSQLNVRLPTNPSRDIEAHMREMCKFHIPLTRIEQQLTKGHWPTTKVLSQPHGKNTIPDNELWVGTEKEWRQHLRTKEVTKINRRATKLRALRKSRTALAKLTSDEWEALKTVFLIQPQFS